MRLSILAVLLLIALGAPLRAGEPAKADAANAIEEALAKKITFDFTDTPLSEALGFLRQIARVNMVVDPAVGKNVNPTVNLKVADMPISQALKWVTQLSGTKWAIEDDAVHVSLAAAPVVGEAAPAGAVDRSPDHLRVRFPDGTDVELSGEAMQGKPSLLRGLLDRALDPGRDGILVYSVSADEAPNLTKQLAQLAPKAKAQFDAEDERLTVTSDDPPTMRRSASLMRKLGYYDVETETAAGEIEGQEDAPAEEPAEDGDAVGKAENPMQPEKPPQPPAEDHSKPIVF
jgi:hypothetical protein